MDIIVHTREGTSSDENAISNRLRTKTGNFFSQSDFDDDLKILAADFDRVNPCITADDDGPLIITIDVWPKNPSSSQFTGKEITTFLPPT